MKALRAKSYARQRVPLGATDIPDNNGSFFDNGENATASHDPKREALGRSITAVLMAKQVRRAGCIHAETILTEIGALAGFAAQVSIRKFATAPRKFDPSDALVEVVSRNGETFKFSDLLNWILFENTTRPPFSIWSHVSAVVPERSRAVMPDFVEIVDNAVRTAGTRQFGVPRLPRAHMPRQLPSAALNQHWLSICQEFEMSRRDPVHWPYDLAWAAQRQMVASQHRLALSTAATIVMEAAIPMSRIDPASVPGAQV
jgi:hypothetical protein